MTTESCQDDNKRVLNIFISRYLLFRTLICHQVLQNEAKLLILGGRLIEVKTIEEPPSGQPKRWPLPLNRGGRLIGVLFTVLY